MEEPFPAVFRGRTLRWGDTSSGSRGVYDSGVFVVYAVSPGVEGRAEVVISAEVFGEELECRITGDFS